MQTLTVLISYKHEYTIVQYNVCITDNDSSVNPPDKAATKDPSVLERIAHNLISTTENYNESYIHRHVRKLDTERFHILLNTIILDLMVGDQPIKLY